MIPTESLLGLISGAFIPEFACLAPGVRHYIPNEKFRSTFFLWPADKAAPLLGASGCDDAGHSNDAPTVRAYHVLKDSQNDKQKEAAFGKLVWPTSAV
jgi:hypothetical protein